MTIAHFPDCRIAYDDSGGSGRAVLLVMGTGSPGRVWQLHQVPALLTAGFRVITLDNRGIPPSDECAEGFTIDDMVSDVVKLIEYLDLQQVVLIGTSLGARIVVETALVRPELVSRVVAMAAHARLEPLQETMIRGEIALAEQGQVPPVEYRAAITALQYLSPSTMRNYSDAQDWLEIFSISDGQITLGHKHQLQISADLNDRREAYRRLTVPVLAIGFADDAAVPPHLAREVADTAVNGEYVEIEDAGHYGYLERPDVVNDAVLRYLLDT